MTSSVDSSSTLSSGSFSSRGARVSISTDSIALTRTSVSASLLPDACLHPTDLLGWSHIAPDGLSPGRIELVALGEHIQHSHEDSTDQKIHDQDKQARNVRRIPIDFSPTRRDEFDAIHNCLTALQAGYPLPDYLTSSETSAATAGSKANNRSEEQLTSNPDSTTADAHQGQLFLELGGDDAQRVGTKVRDGDRRDNPTHSSRSGARRATGAGAEKTKQRRAPWAQIATPETLPETNTNADIDNPIYGQNVTVTGDVTPYDKETIWNLIAQAGGTVGKNVTRKTTMLIVGEWATMTTKEKRARELKEKGQDITLISLKDFLSLVSEEN